MGALPLVEPLCKHHVPHQCKPLAEPLCRPHVPHQCQCRKLLCLCQCQCLCHHQCKWHHKWDSAALLPVDMLHNSKLHAANAQVKKELDVSGHAQLLCFV